MVAHDGDERTSEVVSGSKRQSAGASDGKRQPWSKQRDEIRKHLRRSEIGHAAYRLWDELAYGWAWKDPTCFPSMKVLAKVMRCHRTSLKRALDELIEHGLITREKRFRGYRYCICTEIPAKLRDPYPNNRGLGKSNKGDEESAEEHDAKTHHGSTDRESHVAKTHHSYDAKTHHDSPGYDAKTHHGYDAKTHHVIEAHQREAVQDLRSTTKEEEDKTCEPSAHASGKAGGTISSDPSRSALGDESTEPIEVPENLDDLLEEEEFEEDPRKSPTFRPRKRSPGKDLLPDSGRPQKAFPEAQGSSQSHSYARYDPSGHPPPPGSPESVLWLLRGEVAEKWGDGATRGFPMVLTSKLRGQLRRTLIEKYEPGVIRDMIRLLVWDWEVARGTCFPFRYDVPYPDVLALAQYAKDLAARISSGFAYPMSMRGSVNTYRDLFIDKLEREDDSNPFD